MSFYNDGLGITMLSASLPITFIWKKSISSAVGILLIGRKEQMISSFSSPFAPKFGIQGKPLMKCICIWIMSIPEPIPGLFQKLFMCDVSSLFQ